MNLEDYSISKEDLSEKDYFDLRNPENVYVSKSFSNPDEKIKRIIHKVFEKEEDITFEINTIEHELILRSYPKVKEQVMVVVLQDSNKILKLTLQKFKNNNPQPISFTFRGNEFKELLDFLYSIKFIDFIDISRFKIDQRIMAKDILIDASEKELLEAFKTLKSDDRSKLLTIIKAQNLSKEDLDVLTGRKEGIELFEKKLYNEVDWNESDWQKFFQKNTWIFGYGLDYRFLGILQREAHISGSDLNGKNEVIVDFVVADENFTHLVEVKKPDTNLFGNKKKRSETWTLSKDLIDSISQILIQKAEWIVKSKHIQISEDEPIKQKTVNPKTILIIGNTEQFSGNNKESFIKANTFELFRRNSRDIEIITYDELFKRAYYLVYQKQYSSNNGDINNIL